MNGIIKSMIDGKNFGFIRDAKGIEYFFHQEDFDGHWSDLVFDYHNGAGDIEVEFEPRDTPKGKRADNVSRLDFPNSAR